MHSLWARWSTPPPMPRGTALPPTARCRCCIRSCGGDSELAVTYWDNPVAHIRTEFGFDVLQIASGRYAPDHYRNFIGFKVSKDVLERAFLDTYGMEMKDVFGSVNLALGFYRYA